MALSSFQVPRQLQARSIALPLSLWWVHRHRHKKGASWTVLQMMKMGIDSKLTLCNNLLHCLSLCLRFPLLHISSQMLFNNIFPSHRTYSKLVKTPTSAEGEPGIDWHYKRALGFLAEMVKRGSCLSPDPNASASTYNILVSGFCKRGRDEDIDMTLNLYLEMLQRGFLPSMYTFKMLINCLCKKTNLKEANHLFKLTLDKGFTVDDPSIYFRLIISNCKKGCLNEALQLLHDMQTRNFSPNLETYHALISRFCKENNPVGALGLYNEIGGLQTAFCCSLLVTSLCKQDRVKEACKLMKAALHKGIITQIDAYSTVIRSLCNEGYLVEALELCNEIEFQRKGTGLSYNLIRYNLIITGLCNEGRLVEAFRVFDNMEKDGVTPTLVTYSILISSACKAGYLDEADELLKKLSSKGLSPDLIIYNSMIDSYCKHGKVEEASKFVVEMQKYGILPDSLTLHALIKGHCRKYQVESALALFHEHGRKGMVPIVFSYINIIYVLCHKGRMEEASKLLEEMLDRDLLLGIHSRHGFWSDYCRRFGFMDTKESAVEPQVEVSFDDFIRILCHQGKIQESASILRELELRDVTSQKSADFDGLFHHQIQQNRDISEIMLGECRAHVKQMKCDSHSSDVNLHYKNSIGRFCKEGRLQDALLFYDDMVKKGLVPDFSTYSVLIRSLVANNNMQEANKIMKDMVQPAK